MILHVPATMVLLLFSLLAVAHCGALEADPAATNASSANGVVLAEVRAVPDGEELLRLPSNDDSVASDEVALDGELRREEEDAIKPVAEPDPDRSHPDSDDDREAAATKKPSHKGQEGDEKTEETDDDDDDEKEEEGKKDKKKPKKHHHGCNGKARKKKTKKQRQSDAEEKEETEKQIHSHHHAKEELKKTKKRPHHSKNDDDGDGNDSDDDEEDEKKTKRWKKAISKSRFRHAHRRSQREETVNGLE